jgi:hypothetical protein
MSIACDLRSHQEALGTISDDDLSTNSYDEEGSNSSNMEPNPLEEVKALAKIETGRMRSCKIFVVLSILLTGAAVSCAGYAFLQSKQEDEFTNRVSAFAFCSRNCFAALVQPLTSGSG